MHAPCAGWYLYGDKGSNACPTNSLRIAEADSCISAANAAFKVKDVPEGPEGDARAGSEGEPAGCYLRGNGVVYFNPRKSDDSPELPAGHSSSRLLCSREHPSLQHSCVPIRP
jgi:hypothetical protein